MLETLLYYLLYTGIFATVIIFVTNFFHASKTYHGKKTDHFDGKRFYNVGWDA